MDSLGVVASVPAAGLYGLASRFSLGLRPSGRWAARLGRLKLLTVPSQRA